MNTPHIITEIGTIAQSKTNLHDRLQLSMRATCHHPKLSSNYQQFVAAVLGVYAVSDSTDREHIRENLDALACLSDYIRNPTKKVSIPAPKKALGLLTLWHHVKGECDYVATCTQSKKLN